MGLGSTVRQLVNKATRAPTNAVSGQSPGFGRCSRPSRGDSLPCRCWRNWGSLGKIISSSATGTVGIIRGLSHSGADRVPISTLRVPGAAQPRVQRCSPRVKAASAGRCRQPRFIPCTAVDTNPVVRTRNTCSSSLVQKLEKSYNNMGYNCFIAIFSIENEYFFSFLRKQVIHCRSRGESKSPDSQEQPWLPQ